MGSQQLDANAAQGFLGVVKGVLELALLPSDRRAVAQADLDELRKATAQKIELGPGGIELVHVHVVAGSVDLALRLSLLGPVPVHLEQATAAP